MIAAVTAEQYRKSIGYLNGYLAALGNRAQEYHVDLGGRKKVRIVAYSPYAMDIIRRELTWVLTGPVPRPDATIVIWREEHPEDFLFRVLRLDRADEPAREVLTLFRKDGPEQIPVADVNYDRKTIYLTDGDVYYYGNGNACLEDWISEGHLFAQIFYRILNTPSSTMAHGACVGLDGQGLLCCARGQCGKSTLTVTAMLKGFEYVSDDYLILEKEEGRLLASPVYSIITLSPTMYNTLYDDMDKARFVGVGNWKGKYIFDMSGYRERVRTRYPVRACLFPQITPEASEPSVIPCSSLEKGKAITHMVHSTVAQNMYSISLMQRQKNSDAVLKLIGMLQSLPFYKIQLTPDIFKNVECLRAFAATLK